MMTIDDALIWLADVFEEPVDNITAETKREDIPGWDSLGILNLMAGLDEKFDIILDENEILELRTIQNILDALKRHGQLV